MLSGAAQVSGEGSLGQSERMRAEDVSVDALIAERKRLSERLREIDARIARAAFEAMVTPMPANEEPSPRQREVLDLVLAGKPNKEIAAELHIAERTVKFHVSNLLRIFGASTRIGLARMAASAQGDAPCQG